MNKSYYNSTIKEFLERDEQSILGALTSSENIFDITPKSSTAWVSEIKTMKKSLKDIDGYIHFEFIIPRMGKRVDILLVIKNIIFIIEFKVGSDEYDNASITQVTDYALDIKNFHEGTHDKVVCPILVSTDADFQDNEFKISKDLIFNTINSNELNLGQIIEEVLNQNNLNTLNIDYEDWINSSYKPTPSIIEAAQALYEGHSVKDISRSDAGATNLTITSDEIAKIILDSKNNKKKSICFVTGVPGAGKTLVGLNIATDKSETIGLGKETVFLSGNGPLVAVLSEALAQDKVKKAKEKGENYHISTARREVKKFIQNIHHFRDDNLHSDQAPFEKVVIFDESQRAWNKEMLSKKMREKGEEIDMSEPDLLISHMNKHQDWCVIICLVGGGQEINKGEAGISTWVESMDKLYPDWNVYLSDKITNNEYSWGYSFENILNSQRTAILSNLHLSVSLRSFRSENLSSFMGEVIQGDKNKAISLKEKIVEYPTVITRSLNNAKEWIKLNARGSERFGLVAEANAIRLKPDGVFVKSEIDPAKWFLANKNDVRSSFYLEDVATEYGIQGLELDWVCLCWDAGLRRSNNNWELYKFTGTSFKKRNKENEQKYLINAYRVLLTRARQGIVVFVPKGDSSDHTRLPEFYDETHSYLLECGFDSID